MSKQPSTSTSLEREPELDSIKSYSQFEPPQTSTQEQTTCPKLIQMNSDVGNQLDSSETQFNEIQKDWNECTVKLKTENDRSKEENATMLLNKREMSVNTITSSSSLETIADEEDDDLTQFHRKRKLHSFHAKENNEISKQNQIKSAQKQCTKNLDEENLKQTQSKDTTLVIVQSEAFEDANENQKNIHERVKMISEEQEKLFEDTVESQTNVIEPMKMITEEGVQTEEEQKKVFEDTVESQTNIIEPMKMITEAGVQTESPYFIASEGFGSLDVNVGDTLTESIGTEQDLDVKNNLTIENDQRQKNNTPTKSNKTEHNQLNKQKYNILSESIETEQVLKNDVKTKNVQRINGNENYLKKNTFTPSTSSVPQAALKEEVPLKTKQIPTFIEYIRHKIITQIHVKTMIIIKFKNNECGPQHQEFIVTLEEGDQMEMQKFLKSSKNNRLCLSQNILNDDGDDDSDNDSFNWKFYRQIESNDNDFYQLKFIKKSMIILKFKTGSEMEIILNQDDVVQIQRFATKPLKNMKNQFYLSNQ